jgi:NAD dependent epimerase/dehydratase family enzyme
MRILITGATGPIGRGLTQALLDKGLRPRVLTRRPHRVLESFDSRVLAYEWHPRTEPLPAAALDGVERVFHLMGEPLYGPLTREKRAQILASRRNGTERLIEALGGQPVHLIVASSAAVYGFGDGPPLTERSALKKPRHRLAQTLLACEEAADRLRENGSTVTLVRLGPVIGHGAFPGQLWQLLGQRLDWRHTHPEAAIPAIDEVDAVALLTWLALNRPMPGPVHAVAPEPLRSADLKQFLAQALPRARVGLPRMLLRRRIGVLADFLHSRRRILPQRIVEAGFQFARPDPLESMRSALAEHLAQPARRRASLLGAVLQRT